MLLQTKQTFEISYYRQKLLHVLLDIWDKRNNTLDGIFNNNQQWSSSSQDRTFCEDIEIGDIVLIPFKSQRNCILAKVTSRPECFMKTGFYTTVGQNGTIRIQNNGEIPFCPIGRRIEILSTTVVFEDKRKCISRKSLSQLSPLTVEIVKDTLINFSFIHLLLLLLIKIK